MRLINRSASHLVANPNIVEVDDDEEAKRAQRSVRFASGVEEVPVREPSGAIASFVTCGPFRDASMLLVLERGVAKPITETQEGSESYFECAARGAAEEASPLLQQAMLDRQDRSELTRFNGTPAFLTEVPAEAVQWVFAPTGPPETTAMLWFNVAALLSNTGPVSIADIKGVAYKVTRMATSFAKLAASLVARQTDADEQPQQQTKRAKPAVRVVAPPGGSASRAGLALLAMSAADQVTATNEPLSRSSRANLAMMAAVDTYGDLPRLGEAPRYEREVVLPVDSDFVWPVCTHFALMNHTAAWTLAWNAKGYAACSVSDRRCTAPPPPGCMHVIGRVQEFVAVYPHPLEFVASHVTCTKGAWAANAHWADNVRDGSILAAAEELLWSLCLGSRAAAEQGPSVHARLLGEPNFKTRAEDHGARGHKWYWWWTRNLPNVSPTNIIPPEDTLDLLSAVSSKDAEARMLLRSPIPSSVIEAHAEAWDTHGALDSEPPRAAHEMCREYPSWRAAVLHNYTIFAARYAPRLDVLAARTDGAETKVIIVVPAVWTQHGLAVLVPLQSAHFGARRITSTPIIEQATELSTFLGGGEPMLACHYPPREQSEMIFALHSSASPQYLANAENVREAKDQGADTVWCLVKDAAALDSYQHVLAVSDRIDELRAATHGPQHVVGRWAAALPVVRSRAGEAWHRSQPDYAL